MSNISIIVASSKNQCIGVNNALPWNIKSELKHFRDVTMGKPVIMGRKTFESLPVQLKGRKMIVLSSESKVHEYATFVKTIEDAIRIAEEFYEDNPGEVMVIGGENVYRQFLGCADTIYLTEVDAIVEGDAFFPLDEFKDSYIVENRTSFDKNDTGEDYSFETMILKRIKKEAT